MSQLKAKQIFLNSGDLVVGNSSAGNILSVGTDLQVLKVTSGGLTWASVAGSEVTSTAISGQTNVDSALTSLSTGLTNLTNTVNGLSGSSTSISNIITSIGLQPDGTLTAFTGTITSGSTSVEGAITALDTAIVAETARATSAESALAGTVATETTRATSAEGSLAAAISAETTRATSAEASLAASIAAATTGSVTSADLAAEASARSTADASLAASIAAEVTRATTAEGTLTTAVTNETTRATSAEGSLAAALAAEVTRAQAAEANAVLIAGSTMTGALILSGDPTAPLQAATKQYVDNSLVSLGQVFTYKGAVAANALPTSGQNTGDYYKITTNGTIGGVPYAAGDAAVWNGTGWDKIEGVDVSLTAGASGNIIVTPTGSDSFTVDLATALVGITSLSTGTITTTGDVAIGGVLTSTDLAAQDAGGSAAFATQNFVTNAISTASSSSARSIAQDEWTGGTTYTLSGTPLTGSLAVYVNGLKLRASEFSVTAGAVVLGSLGYTVDSTDTVAAEYMVNA